MSIKCGSGAGILWKRDIAGHYGGNGVRGANRAKALAQARQSRKMLQG